jgi:hypothetical protein
VALYSEPLFNVFAAAATAAEYYSCIQYKAGLSKRKEPEIVVGADGASFDALPNFRDTDPPQPFWQNQGEQ